MNFAFFGTDEVSIGVLEALKSGGFTPCVVVTRVDRPAGRKQLLTSPPVKIWSQGNSVPVLQPEKLNSDFISQLSQVNCQMSVVASYGKIIPKSVLGIFPKGVLNVHPSLLPKYRGPTPFQTALLDGVEETGVTIMLMDEEMDHGDIVASTKHEIRNSKNYTELGKELAKLGGDMLVDVIPKWVAGEITPVPQDHSQATFTHKFTSEDGFIKPETILGGLASKLEVEYAERQVRALNPEPGTFTRLNFKNKILAGGQSEIRLKILSATIEKSSIAHVLENMSYRLVPIRVIPAGKKEMSWENYLRGNNKVS